MDVNYVKAMTPYVTIELIELNLFSKITKIHDKQSMNMHVIFTKDDTLKHTNVHLFPMWSLNYDAYKVFCSTSILDTMSFFKDF